MLSTRFTLIVALTMTAMPAATLPSPTLAARDGSGFLYFSGTVLTRDLPTTSGVLQPTTPAPPLTPIPFVAKAAPDGTVVWTTYFGGDGTDVITAIAVAPNADLIVAGNTTSTTLLPDRQGYRLAPASLFLARLTPDGSTISRATYFGGREADTITSLLIDGSGNIYIAGTARSVQFPTTPGAYQTSGAPALFIAKFDSDLRRLLFSTLVGYTILDSPPIGPSNGPAALALGADGSLYLAATGPLSFGPLTMTVTHLTADGSQVLYATSFPSDDSIVGGIAVDTAGGVYVATFQRRYPIVGPASVIQKLSPTGAPLWSSGIAGANISSLMLDGPDELVFTGLAGDVLFPTTPGAPRACLSSNMARPHTYYVARFRTDSRRFTYAGYLNATRAWLTADPRVIITDSAFAGLPRFATLPTSMPRPGTVFCVANAATADLTSTAPGEILSIYGTDIGPDQPLSAELDAEGNITKSLGGVTVTFDGIPAPVFYAGPGQINLVAPFSLRPGTTHIELRRTGILLLAMDRTVTESHPAFFTTNGFRGGPLAALNQDGTVNTADNPAVPGSIVSIFGTGLGTMTPTAVDGSIPQGPGFRPTAAFSFSLFIASAGGFSPEVLYLGNAPGSVQGAIQINFRLPAVKPSDGIVTGPNGTIWVR